MGEKKCISRWCPFEIQIKTLGNEACRFPLEQIDPLVWVPLSPINALTDPIYTVFNLFIAGFTKHGDELLSEEYTYMFLVYYCLTKEGN